MRSARNSGREGGPPAGTSRTRRLVQRGAFIAVLVALAALLLHNIDQNLAERGLSLSFDFLARPAGFG